MNPSIGAISKWKYSLLLNCFGLFYIDPFGSGYIDNFTDPHNFTDPDPESIQCADPTDPNPKHH